MNFESASFATLADSQPCVDAFADVSPAVEPARVETKQAASNVLVHASSVEFERDCFLNPPFTNKLKGFKLVKVTKSRTNLAPLAVQFSSQGGRIPDKFGVQVNAQGKTMVTFSIACPVEYERLVQFQNAVKEYAKQHKNEWWPYPITDNQIDDNFSPLVSARKAKTDSDGFWDGNFKAQLNLNEQGEPLNDKGGYSCEIEDADGSRIKKEDLINRRYDTAVVELGTIYFQNKYTWGFGPKVLKLIKLAPQSSTDRKYSNYTEYVLPKPILDEPSNKRSRTE